MRLAGWLALSALALSHGSSARAEGSGELDLGEAVWDGSAGFMAHDQAVSATTVLRVDILNGGDEKVCWSGTGNATLRRPDASFVANLANGSCAAAGAAGAHFLALAESQRVGTRWDVRVCALGVSDQTCLEGSPSARSGRLWSSSWNFSENTSFLERSSVNGSLYARLPGGADQRDAVIELQMRGVAGAFFKIRANGTGPTTSTGVRVGRSVPESDAYSVAAEYPLYLNPPEAARYDWVRPQLGAPRLGIECGRGVVQGLAAAKIQFLSNASGRTLLVCDVDKNGAYELTGSRDFVAHGTALVGENEARWDGRDSAGVAVAEGSYSCLVRLNLGEFHYVAEDIETAYPGIRMYRVEPDKLTRTALRMFWDDSAITVSENMPNGQLSPSTPLAAGLDPTPASAAPAAFHFIGGDRARPLGNARAWGDFDLLGRGKGNGAYLDQFTAVETALSAPLSVSVINATGDSDADGLGNTTECAIGSDPRSGDSDADGIPDSTEAPSGTAPNLDGDALPDVADEDDDGDGVPTRADAAPRDAKVCRDLDLDGCDDCSQTGGHGGAGDPAKDGPDQDGDGRCDVRDPDDDGDGVTDGEDPAPGRANACGDSDLDSCDDCSALGLRRPEQDGPDEDGDGVCDAGESVPLLDADGDGRPDADDLDDDGDGVLDAQESVAGQREDADADGARNALDLDADADGIYDADESGHDAADKYADGRVDGPVGQNGVVDALERASSPPTSARAETRTATATDCPVIST
ncbi:MAG TPA: hypothetical protein VFZ61_04130, partial [Polyangiales bacterium]